MIRQVRVFRHKGNEDKLEQDINAFLRTIPYPDVLEIKGLEGSTNMVIVVYRVHVARNEP